MSTTTATKSYTHARARDQCAAREQRRGCEAATEKVED